MDWQVEDNYDNRKNWRSELNIGLVQYNPVWENKELNKQRINQLVKGLPQKLDLLIFPELTLTGFTMRSKRFAEQIYGESYEYFCTLAKHDSCHIFFGLIESDRDKFYNTLIHLSPEKKLINTYRKVHPFSFTGENRHYASGSAPKVPSVQKFSIGLSICYDLRFPELYRQYAKKRVDLIVDIANWPVDRIGHWYALLKARAIENQCYVVGVNRVGTGKSIDYPGWSSVFQPFGEELLCYKGEEGVKILKIDKKSVENTRAKYPFLNDICLL